MATTTNGLRTTRSIRTTIENSPVWRVGAVAAIVGAVATVVFALCAEAIDVPMKVEGESIPVLGFAMMVLLWTAVGTVLAVVLDRRAKHPARTFVVTTVVLTLLSFGPVLNADATTATQVTLALTHVLAAAIVIPALALRLSHEQ